LRAENGPCVVFDDIPGCPKGFRLLLNIFAGTRRNMTFGFPDHLGKWELSEAYRDAYLKDMKLVPHEIVADGPVLENIMTGDDVDVLKFPSPIWHEKDGGRYIGTGTYSITRDPDENWLNAGAYRAQVHDKNSVGVLMATGHHGYLHREKYWKKGEPLPIVMVLGGDPLAFFYGGTEAPYGVFEMDIIGGLRGRPVKMVKGRVTGLPFPAHAEIVLEGYITPDKRATEGPFGEWTGHYAGGAAARPVLDIKAIYHRNDPILLGVPPMGAGPDEMARYRAVLRSAMVKQNMTAAGVPEVVQVWCHEIGGSRLLHGVAIKQKYPGHATQAGFIAAQCGAAAYASKYVIVVDDDVDVTNLDHLLWAMLTRTEPKESIQFIQNAWDSPADPRLAPEKRAVGDMTHSVAVINACKPYHWRDKFPPSNTPSPEITRKAKEKFGWLLDGKKP
jgi:4-hydroxy-3-polyprenylbenzoate decarboxylase